MRALLPLAVFVHAAQALEFTLPHKSVTPGPYTIIYISNASDPAGSMTFWYGRPSGKVAPFVAAQNVMHTTTPKQLQVNVSEAAADGSQYQFYASQMGNDTGTFFGHSAIFRVQPASSSATPSGSTNPSAPALSASSSPASIAATPAPLASIVATPSADSNTPRKSSPSAGLIAGVVLAAAAALAIALGLLLLCVRRHRRAHRRVKELDLEPGWAGAPGYSTHSATATIEPYTAAPDQAGARPSAKAAAERQAFLTNQLAAVQAQLAALALAGAGAGGGARPVSPSPTPSVSDSPSPATGGGDADAYGAELRKQNAALHARIGLLEEQLRSQWALGLSDEPPPGYHDLQ